MEFILFGILVSVVLIFLYCDITLTINRNGNIKEYNLENLRKEIRSWFKW